ncbi:hypothetical protein PoB_007239600 [Plakobranchus ocellatus]|uniref:Uncharacterized protein n=1 Tax=Plakobranchus ocellatus TaxID=259542 RepID=A0AAV4DP47_9GAST|nr:hypothetical protein PoB_007239600 [Plakobranchus ocellatus]
MRCKLHSKQYSGWCVTAVVGSNTRLMAAAGGIRDNQPSHFRFHGKLRRRTTNFAGSRLLRISFRFHVHLRGRTTILAGSRHPQVYHSQLKRFDPASRSE